MSKPYDDDAFRVILEVQNLESRCSSLGSSVKMLAGKKSIYKELLLEAIDIMQNPQDIEYDTITFLAKSEVKELLKIE